MKWDEKRQLIPRNLFRIELVKTENNQQLFEITKILNFMMKIKIPYKVKEVAQCHRCQMFQRLKKAKAIQGGHPDSFRGCLLCQQAIAKKYPVKEKVTERINAETKKKKTSKSSTAPTTTAESYAQAAGASNKKVPTI